MEIPLRAQFLVQRYPDDRLQLVVWQSDNIIIRNAAFCKYKYKNDFYD